MSVIDCRGLACPEPVVVTKRALEGLWEGELTVIVDDPISCENVKRFVAGQGCSVNVEEHSDEFHIHVRKSGGQEVEGVARPREEREVILYLNSSFIGIGDDALGSVLMRAFTKTILEADTRPSKVIHINAGVRLAAEGSDVLETLKDLSKKGVEILSCGTCVDFYGLKEKLRVGKITNMYEIVRLLQSADRVIRP